MAACSMALWWFTIAMTVTLWMTVFSVRVEGSLDSFGWEDACQYGTARSKPQVKVNGASAKVFTGTPVYISIATIHARVEKVSIVIKSLLEGYIIPDRIFLFISREKHLLDEGIPPKKIPDELFGLCEHFPVSVVYTENIGPHRKLLPLLRREYSNDSLIATADDDRKYHPLFLYGLVRYYVASKGSSVVAYRARRVALCVDPPHKPRKYGPQWAFVEPNHEEMLVLPTGTGGVLYHPKFFHPVVFNPAFREATATTDDITFRIATMMKGVKVLVACMSGVDPDTGELTVLSGCTEEYVTSRYGPDKAYTPPPLTQDEYSRIDSSPVRGDKDTRVSLYSHNMGKGNSDHWWSAYEWLKKESVTDFSMLLGHYLKLERHPKCEVTYLPHRNLTELYESGYFGITYCCDGKTREGAHG